MMIDAKKMFEVCNYVVKNHARIIDVCDEFKMSRKTAQKYTGEYLRRYIEETNDELAKELLSKLEEIKNENEQATQIKNVDVDLNEVISYIKENDKELYNRLKDAQKEISERGNALGGKTGIRGPKYTDFEAVEIAETMIEHDLTVKESGEKFNMPKSTLYETIRRIKDDDIQDELDEIFDRKNK